jgi:hypothetical protein
MEVVNFEKFLFFNKCELTIAINQTKKLEKLKVNFLFTLNNIYFLGDHPENKSKPPEEVELEKNLICKINQEQFYVSNYDDQAKMISFSSRLEDVQMILEIKDIPAKDFKDFVNICLIMDGYKIIIENNGLDYSSYSEYLLYLIENIITNSGSLLIEDNFFTIDYNFLSSLANFFTRIEKLVVKVNLYEIDVVKIFLKIFCEEDEVFSSTQNNKIEEIPCLPKLNLLKVLKLVENDLNDQGFSLLLDLFDQTEFLTELEISKNHITNSSLTELSDFFAYRLKYLEKLNLSNNLIDSIGLDDFVKNVLENLPKLTLLDLSANFIDNEFLQNFDINYLRKVCTKYEFNEVMIDVCKNRFDTHLQKMNFYQWRPEEDGNTIEKGIYTLDHFLQNVATMKIKIKFKVDCIKHFKEIKDLDPYKKQLEATGKCVKIYCKTVEKNTKNLNIEKSAYNNEKTEIEQYQELFQLFYLIDQFFDPNLNNFNNKDHNQNINYSLGYLDSTNRTLLYSQLSNYISHNILTPNNFNYYNVNLQMQQYNNIQMVIANNHFSGLRNKIIQKLFKKDGDLFNPNVNIEDLNDFFNFIKNSVVDIPCSSLHKFINRVKIESLLSLKDKDLFSLEILSEICTFFRMSFMEKVEIELISLKEKAEIISKALLYVLNFEGHKIENKFFIHEINNFLDFFLKEADTINLKNNVVLIAKYIQYSRNNKLRAKCYNIYENILKEENLFQIDDNISSEFDLIYKKYRHIEDFEKLRIPEEVKNKILSLHPLKLDYLKLSEVNLEDLESDLKIVSDKLTDEESYGIRNIHDRIHFFLTKSNFIFLRFNYFIF